MKSKDNNEPKLSELEIKLPREILKSIFTFFNQKELRITALISKTFKQLSLEELCRLSIQYKDNLFYTVGNPIHISNPNRTIFDVDLSMKHRKNYP